MGATYIAKNAVSKIEDDISSYLDQGTDLQSIGGVSVSVSKNSAYPELDAMESESFEEQTIRIGLTQEGQTPRMDAANQGILQALADSGIEYQIDQQNASGEHYVQQVTEPFWITKIRCYHRDFVRNGFL